MPTNRFVNDSPMWPALWLSLGFFLGVVIGGFFLLLPGALLGAALGMMVAYRAMNIRPQLPRSRTIDAADHPTEQARAMADPAAFTNAPFRRDE